MSVRQAEKAIGTVLGECPDTGKALENMIAARADGRTALFSACVRDAVSSGLKLFGNGDASHRFITASPDRPSPL